MSTLLLEKLQKKPVPKDIEKPVAIRLGSAQVELQINIEDQTKTSNFDVSLLKERIKRRGLSAPVVEMKSEPSDDETKGEPQKVNVPVSKPKKLKSTVKLPGKKRPKKEKQSESVILSVPPESIIYQDNPLQERLPSKSPNVLI